MSCFAIIGYIGAKFELFCLAEPLLLMCMSSVVLWCFIVVSDGTKWQAWKITLGPFH